MQSHNAVKALPDVISVKGIVRLALIGACYWPSSTSLLSMLTILTQFQTFKLIQPYALLSETFEFKAEKTNKKKAYKLARVVLLHSGIFVFLRGDKLVRPFSWLTIVTDRSPSLLFLLQTPSSSYRLTRTLVLRALGLPFPLLRAIQGGPLLLGGGRRVFDKHRHRQSNLHV